jgi:hypothetical protein
MGVRDSIRAYNVVITWINNSGYDLGKPAINTFKSVDAHLNAIFISFGRKHNIQMEKDNSSAYRGCYCPMRSNCIRIQARFEDFKIWIKENYKTFND